MRTISCAHRIKAAAGLAVRDTKWRRAARQADLSIEAHEFSEISNNY